jgi:predicted HAD superfamily Cof-like phosphohydrolase
MARRNRRTFLQSIAGAPLVISAAETAQAQEPASPLAGQVDALAQLVNLRYGKYLTEGDMPEIKRGIERMLRNAETISKIQITNADEPDFMFHPFGSL